MIKKIVAIFLGLEVAAIIFMALFKTILLWIITGIASNVFKLHESGQKAFDLLFFFLISAILISAFWVTVDKLFKQYLILLVVLPLISFTVYYFAIKEPDKDAILSNAIAHSSTGIPKPKNYNVIKNAFERNLNNYYDTTKSMKGSLFLGLFSTDKKDVKSIQLDTLIFSNDYKFAYAQYVVQQTDVFYAESLFCKFQDTNQMEFIPASIYNSFNEIKKQALTDLRYQAFIESRKRLMADYSNNDYRTWYKDYPSPIDKGYWTKTFPEDSTNMRAKYGSLKAPISNP